ncbi:MAG: hypothetical protein MI866_01075, partial [Bacteroidales bacterium]|nr:hypothetical protein [Bacteroidales bacterium]
MENLEYVYHSLDGMEMYFDPNTVYDPNAPAGGSTNWKAAGGVKTVQDRFGNALNYIWDENNICVKQITNNRTNAGIKFNLLTVQGKEYPFYLSAEAGLFAGETLLAEETRGYGINWQFLTLVTAYRGADDTEYIYSTVDGSDDGNLYLIEKNVRHYSGWQYNTFIEYNDKGEYIAARYGLGYNSDITTGYIPENMAKYSIDTYIETNDDGISHKIQDFSIRGQIFKKVTSKLNDIGIPLNQITTHYLINQDFDTQDYEQIADLACNPDNFMLSYWTYNKLGNMNDFEARYNRHEKSLYNDISGVADYFYEYQNERFPSYPTTIRICMDDDGDQNEKDNKTYDSKRLIQRCYDERGNVILQKRYINAKDYTATVYEYHPVYNFRTRETTWQNYCTDDDDGEMVIPSSGKVEKQWIYGLANGTVSPDPKDNVYLIKQMQLLDQDSDLWAIAEYTYNNFGQPETITDPESNITYIQYDSHGFMEKIWQGVSQTPPTGNPQQRFLFNSYGRKLLEADPLGKVIRYDYGSYYTVENRIYFDETAISRTDFNLSTYPDQSLEENQNGYQSLTGQYSFTEKGQPLYTVDDKGGHINCWMSPNDSEPFYSSNYAHNGEYIYYAPYSNKTVDYSWDVNDIWMLGYGTPYIPADMGPAQFAWNNRPGGAVYLKHNNHRNIQEPGSFVYSSLDCNDRVMEKYSGSSALFDLNTGIDNNNAFFYNFNVNEPSKICKHESFEYYASGQKKSEKVYKVSCNYNEAADEYTYSRELEKYSTFSYDRLDRLIKLKNYLDPNDTSTAQVIEYGYDAVGNQIYMVDPAGNVIFTDYDNANRKAAEYHPVEPVLLFDVALDVEATKANAIVKQAIEYDSNGKVTQVLSYDYDETLLAGKEMSYDSRQRIESTIEYIEDLTGNGDYLDPDETAVTTIQYSDVKSDFGLIPGDPNYHVCITDAEGKNQFIQLHPTGNPAKILYSSGDYEEMTYDSFGRMVEKAVWSD